MVPSLRSLTVAASEYSLTGSPPFSEGIDLFNYITIPALTDKPVRSHGVVLTLQSSDREGWLRGMVLKGTGNHPENFHEKRWGYYLLHG